MIAGNKCLANWDNPQDLKQIKKVQFPVIRHLLK